MKKLAETYIYGNFHIALIAALCFYLYNSRMNQAAIVFLATFSYYNFCSIISVKNYSIAQSYTRLTWISKFLTEIIFMITSSSVLAIFLWIKLCESYQYRIDKIAFVLSLALCLLYLFVRQVPVLKNLLIGIVWVLVMHIWVNIDYSFLDLFLLMYLTGISIWYDRATSQYKRALIDILIIAPFLIHSLAEKLSFDSLKP